MCDYECDRMIGGALSARMADRDADPGSALVLHPERRAVGAAATAGPGAPRRTRLGPRIQDNPAGTRATRFRLARGCIWRNALGKYSRTFYMRK